ncbi:MAG: hypothetical protein GX856_00455 [Gammaproteobacteria bacterium]|nr:hypothetical protein [Gammaproteobacteria bacterium]
MTLHILVVIDPEAPRGTAEWYFDNHAHFLRARRSAQEVGIFITDRTDFITDIHEFNAWLKRKELREA